MFYKISSSVGSGKTQAVLEHITGNLNTGYIIVAPTVELCTEIWTRLLTQFAEGPFPNPVYANGQLVRLVVRDDKLGEVYPRALHACKEYNQHLPPIIIVTTVTFLHLMSNLDPNTKAKFDVFIDEGLPPIKTEQFFPANIDEFMQYFDQAEDGFISARHGYAELLEWVAYQPAKLAGARLQHLAVPEFREICGLVVSGNFDVFIDLSEKGMRAVSVLAPTQLLPFRSVTMIVAIFDQTLLPILWKHRYDTVFENHKLEADLFDSHSAKGPLIGIYYLLHEGDGPSKRHLQRNAESGVENEADHEKQVIYEMAKTVEQSFPDGSYCWAANNFFKNPGDVMQGRRMPAVCAGLDSFRHYDTVVSLLCINPQPWVKNVLTSLFQLEDSKLYELWRFSHTYQVVGRCSLRNRSVNRDIRVVVLSKRCAEQVCELFIGSKVIGQLGKLPRYSKGQDPNQIDLNDHFVYSAADNTAFSKYNARNKTKGVEGLNKANWYQQERMKNLKA